MRGRRNASLLIAVVVLAAAAGCGGGEEDPQTAQSAEAPAVESQGVDNNQAGDGGGDQAGDGRGEGSSTGSTASGGVVENPTPAQLGIESGADNSLQTYGEAAEGEDLDEAVRRMRGYFRALAGGGLGAACPYFTEPFRRDLLQAARQADRQPSAGGCTGLDAALRGVIRQGALRAEARQAARATVLRVGVEDENAIVMLRTPDGKLAYFVMEREDDEWRVSTLSLGRLPS